MTVWTCHAPRPFSLNHMFANVPGKGRAKTRPYRDWRDQCEGTIMAQGPRHAFAGPVTIKLTFGMINVSAGFDTDNGIKGYLDVLKRMGVIADDNRQIVRRIEVDWAATAEGAWIVVEGFEG